MKRLLLAFLVLFAAHPAIAQPDPSSTIVQGATGEALDNYLLTQVEDGFSGAVLAAVDGQVVLQKGYGFADPASQRVRNTPATVFQIGSVTKPVTATLVQMLADAGVLDLQAPMSDYLDGVPTDKTAITLHHLLTHTAGFADALGSDEDAIGRDAFLRLAFSTPLDRAPGTGYGYSNVGFAILGAIIETVTGQPYDTVLQERMLQPAGITHTGYRLDPDLPVARSMSRGQDQGLPFDNSWAPDGPYWHLRANGGLLSTVGDLYRLHLGLEDGTLLSETSRQLSTMPHTDEGPRSGSHYGYGWALFPAPGGILATHNGGGDGGFTADFYRFLDDGKVLIVLSNDDRVTAMRAAQPLVGLLFGRDVQPIRLARSRPVGLDALGVSERGQRALAFVEMVQAGEAADVAAFVDAHLDAGFQRNPDGVQGFFRAVADEVGHAPITLERAVWADGERLSLFARLADGRLYWIELGFDRENRIAGMQTDYAADETPAALPNTPAGRAVEALRAALSGGEAARRAYISTGLAERLRSAHPIERHLDMLNRLSDDLAGAILTVNAEGSYRVSITVEAARGPVRLTFEVEPEEPHGLVGIEAEG